ncbi:hypothetical protein HDU93_003314 [Gonapodya sp. JEL0774]|nr:hypothetical protein HDU93_003314 [Gonapodya sp. JEL0774]
MQTYTPISPVTLDEDDGTFELVIKIYEKGAMSQILETRVNPSGADRKENRMMVRGPSGGL